MLIKLYDLVEMHEALTYCK